MNNPLKDDKNDNLKCDKITYKYIFYKKLAAKVLKFYFLWSETNNNEKTEKVIELFQQSVLFWRDFFLLL